MGHDSQLQGIIHLSIQLQHLPFFVGRISLFLYMLKS